MIKSLKKNNKNKKGFTLIETLVAVSIFSMSIVISMMVLSNGMSNTIYAKQKVIATYLAQEGIEYMRNMRDTYTLYETGGSQVGWVAFNSKLTNAGALCDQANGCYFGDLSVGDFSNSSQPITGITVASCGATCPVLYYDANTGKYSYSGSTISDFTRKIRVIPQVGGEELKISSTVSWTVGSKTFSVSLYENLFNWVEQ